MRSGADPVRLDRLACGGCIPHSADLRHFSLSGRAGWQAGQCGDFGVFTACSPLANDFKLLSKVKVKIGVNDSNKLVINSIEK